jgi:threonine dehydrogenase-like Zn-dependent dehydrogenase
MKVLRYPVAGKAEIVEVPTPKPAGDQVLCKSLYCNISAGTEMGFYRGTAPQMNYGIEPGWFFVEKPGNITYPMQSDGEGVWWMGYANVSEVLESGPEVKNLKPGDVVFSQVAHKTHQLIPEGTASKLPEGTNPEHAALTALIEIAFNGILDAGIRLMDNVAVFGLGTLGQLLVQMAKRSGAKVFAVDGLKNRMDLAGKMGADHVIDHTKGRVAERIYENTDGKGADVVFEVSGNIQALPEAIRAAAYNGKVTVLSFYQDPAGVLKLGNEFHHKRVSLQCSQILGILPALSNTWDMARRRAAALELVSLLDIKPLISHRYDFEDSPKALEFIDRKPGDCNAVILKY